MITIVYDSKTGLGKKFAEKLPYPAYSVELPMQGPCILVTRNVGLGMISSPTQDFLSRNSSFVKGVVVNGNKRFGRFYCAAGPKIAKRFGIAVLRNIEGEGTLEDAQAVIDQIQSLAAGA